MDAPSPRSGRALLFGALVWGIVIVRLFGSHFSTVYFPDIDSWFHARFASELPGRLFARTFSTTPYSVWAQQFGDKEWLFHLWMMPFCQWEAHLVDGAKLAAALLGLGFFVSLRVVLARQRIAFPELWILLLAVSSGEWWYRLMMVRAQLLSIFLFVWVVWAYAERRAGLLAVLVGAFAWSYTASFLGGAIVFALALGRRLVSWVGGDGGGADGRCLLAAGAGLLLMVVVHPQTPNHLVTLWICIRLILGQAWGITPPDGIGLAVEFQSPSLRDTLVLHPGTCLALAGAWMIAAFGGRRWSPRTSLLLWGTVPFFGLYCLSSRFIEYLAPMAVWGLAAVATEWWPGAPGVTARQRGVALAAACLALIGLHVHSGRRLNSQLLNPFWWKSPAAALSWLNTNARPGDLVVLPNWGLFPEAYFRAPQLRYPVGMDPMLMAAIHPGEARLLADIDGGRRRLDLREVSAAFPDGRWFLVGRQLSPDLFEWCRTHREGLVYEDAQAVVLRLGP